jgi:uncharacterized spore protein YtfJ
MSTLTTLNVRIAGDITDFNKKMTSVSSRIENVGRKMQSVGKSMTFGLTVPLLAMGGAMVKTASDAAEMQSKFDTVFKTVGGDVTRSLGNFASAANRSRFELMGMASELGDIIKPMGFSEAVAGDMAVTLTKLAVDLGSFNNMPMGEALTRLRGALIGAHENVATFGVIINENTLKQELARMGADKFTGSLKEQAKVQARMNLIMAQTTDAQNDAVRTSGGFANQLEGLKNSIKDLGIQIGNMLLPHAQKLVVGLRGMVEIVSNLSPQIQRTALAVAGFAAAFGPAVFVVGGLASSMSAVFNVGSLLMGLFSPLGIAMVGIGVIAFALARNWDSVTAAVSGFYDSIVDDFQPAIDQIKSYVENVVDIGASIFGTLLTWWDDNRDGVFDKVGAMMAAISGALGAGIDAAYTVINKGLGIISGLWTAHGAEIITILGGAFNQTLLVITNAFTQMANVIGLGMAILKPGWEGEWTALKNIVDTQLTYTNNTASNFVTTIKDTLDVGDAALDEKFGSTDFKTLVEGAMTGITTAITNMKTSGLSLLGDFGDGAKKELTGDESVELSAEDVATAFDNIKTAVGDVDGLNPAFAVIKSALSGGKSTAILFDSALRDIELAVGGVDKLAPSFATIKSALSGGKVDADALESAFGNIETAVGDTDKLAPSFATIKSALSSGKVDAEALDAAFGDIETAVNDADKLAPSFQTLRDALSESKTFSVGAAASNAGRSIGGVKNVVAELEGYRPNFSTFISAIKSVSDEAVVLTGNLRVPSTLEMPEWDVDPPSEEDINAWGLFGLKVQKASDYMGDLGSDTGLVAGALMDVKGGLDALFGSKLGGWADKITKAATDVADVVLGFEALLVLFKAETWDSIIDILVDVKDVIKWIVLKVWGWFDAQTAVNTASQVNDTINTLMPGAGAGVGAGGGAGTAGTGGGAGTALGLAATALVFVESIRRLFKKGTSLADLGLTLEQWQQMASDSGVFLGGAGWADNLSGVDLSGWGDFSDMGGWQGRATGGQNVYVMLDGQTIANATVPYMAEELTVYGTNY